MLAASLRHPMHVVEAALAGADIATMPYDVFTKLVKHPLTDIGLERFQADWKKLQKDAEGEGHSPMDTTMDRSALEGSSCPSCRRSPQTSASRAPSACARPA